jgi:hypothetical protein
MAKEKRWHPSQESDEIVFGICDRFLGRGSAKVSLSAIVHWLHHDMDRKDLTRERVYPLVREAVRRGFVLLQPPREQYLAGRLADAYGARQYEQDSDVIQVINARGIEAAQQVAAIGGDLLYSLVTKAAKKKAKDAAVHIGLGGGFASMILAKRLAQCLYTEVGCPKLVLHALSAGSFLVDEPYRAPITYLSYFQDALVDVEFVSLFSETVVRSDEDYEKVKANPGVRRSFQQSKDIDIVVTSLAVAGHEHGLLVKYLQYLIEDGTIEKDSLARMQAAGWRGDVQFRPYTSSGAMIEECPVRAVTLFELSDLVQMAQTPDKSVILLGGPCGNCGETKAEALRPLLENPHLRLWTHLLTDVQTAKELLE